MSLIVTNRYQNCLNRLTSDLAVQKNPTVSKICLTLEFISYLCVAFILASFLATYKEYNSPFYVVETDFKKWVTVLPAYTVCPVVNDHSFAKYLQKFTGVRNGSTLDFLTGLLDPSEGFCKNCRDPSKVKFPKGGYGKIVEEVSQLCEGLLLNCYWKGKPFQCCQFFQRIPTGFGICYSINSAHVKFTDSVPPEMVTSYNEPEPVLQVEAAIPIRIFVHDRRDLSFFNNDIKVTALGESGKVFVHF